MVYLRQFSKEMDFPCYSGYPEIYMIASTPRCGSHYLGHTLFETGSFGVPLEYLNYRNIKLWKERFNKKDRYETFDEIIKVRTSPSTGVFGFKAHWNQFQKYQETDIFEKKLPFSKIIFIFRKDLLAQSVSYVIASQTRRWISEMPAQREPRYNYDLIVNAAVMINKYNRQWFDYITRSELPVYKLCYEDLLADKKKRLKEVFDFIKSDVPSEYHPASNVKKQGSDINEEWKRRFLNDMKAEHVWIVDMKRWDV